MTEAARAAVSDKDLWAQIEEKAEWIGVSKAAYRSDMFELLALILAYYQSRGTTPTAMATSPTMQARIAFILGNTK